MTKSGDPNAGPSAARINHAQPGIQMRLQLLEQQKKQIVRQQAGLRPACSLQDHQMQLMLLEQQNRKRLMMARQEQDGPHVVSPQFPTLNNGPSRNHALQDYQMQLMLLEQQNKRRLMMARQEQDGPYVVHHLFGTTGIRPGPMPRNKRRYQPKL